MLFFAATSLQWSLVDSMDWIKSANSSPVCKVASLCCLTLCVKGGLITESLFFFFSSNLQKRCPMPELDSSIQDSDFAPFWKFEQK